MQSGKEKKPKIDPDTKAHYAVDRIGDIITCHCGYVGISDEKYSEHPKRISNF